jgi:hypothetical protein
LSTIVHSQDSSKSSSILFNTGSWRNHAPADLQLNNVNGKHAHLVFHADSVQKTNVEDSDLVNIDHHFSKALPSKVDYERLSPYFAFRSHDVIQHTLRQTTQLAKSTIHYPMRRHLESRFQKLRNKKLNEVIATDKYFSSVKSIEGYYCAQVFFGMTSKMLYVAGMKTESEFPDVYLDFIRQRGIPSTLRRDNACNMRTAKNKRKYICEV